MTKIFQETLGGKPVEVSQKKRGPWRGMHPHFAAPSPFPTPREIKRGEVDWYRLGLMAQAVKRVLGGEDPQKVADDIRLENRLPGF